MQSNYNVVYFPSAYSDITEIMDYITNTLCSPQSANRLLAKIKNAIENLALFPFSGTELKLEDNTLHFPYRWLNVDNYMIFYVVEKENGTVSIMRILYGASNYITSL